MSLEEINLEKMSRKEKEDLIRQKLILDNAEKLFFENGLHETSVADIAKLSEFGIGTIYKYFKDKNTIIKTMILNNMTAHFDALEKSLIGDDPAPVLIDRLIEAYLTSLKTKMKFFKIHFTHFYPGSQDTDTPKETMSLCHQRQIGIGEKMEKIFEKGIANGDFANIEPQYLTSALYGMLISFYFLAEFKYNGKINVAEMKKALKTIMFDKVLIKNSSTLDKNPASEAHGDVK